MPAASKLEPKPATLEQLFALGQESASRWLRKSFDAVGQRTSIDLRRDYGDPLRLDFEQPDDAADEEAAAREAPDALAAIDTAEDGDARATDKSPGPAA